MFENNNMEDFDLMMKSILDEGREEVPERVWEGVSAGLDKAARRKTVVLWWKRTAAGIAAAAVVALGVFFTYDRGDEMVPAGDGEMIAVVEPAASEEADSTEIMEVMMAEARVGKPVSSFDVPVSSLKEAASAISMARGEEVETVVIPEEKVENEHTSSETVKVTEEKKPVVEDEAVYFPDDWGEEEKKDKRDVAVVLSGLTGTNNTLSQNRIGPMKSPVVAPAPTKSGIEETSTKSSYGIPLSFGAGVKIDLNSRWSIGAGLNYTFLSRQFFGKYTKVDENGISAPVQSDVRNQQHYIGIPVNAFYNIINNDRINFYAYAGGTVEKCVSDSYSLLNTPITHKEKAEGVQFSANAGIGVEFMLGKHLGLYVDPSVRYYFKNKTQPKSIRTVQPLMLGFEMGFRARL